MLTLEQIKVLLEDRNLSKVAIGCGVHYNAITRLMNGSQPAYTTVKKLSDYLEGKDENKSAT